MRDADWNALRNQIPRETFLRLTAMFKRFCDGYDDLPEQAFRRSAGSEFGRLEEFVADSVLVIGRRGTDDRFQTFFTTEVRIGVLVASPVEDRPKPQQAQLPLDINTKQQG
jgi:hypothetical protein